MEELNKSYDEIREQLRKQEFIDTTQNITIKMTVTTKERNINFVFDMNVMDVMALTNESINNRIHNEIQNCLQNPEQYALKPTVDQNVLPSIDEDSDSDNDDDYSTESETESEREYDDMGSNGTITDE